MNDTSRLTLRWPVLVLAAILLLAVGASTTYWILRPGVGEQGGTGTLEPAHSAAPPDAVHDARSNGAVAEARPSDVVIRLTPEAVTRAGITVGPVTSGTAAPSIRLPAVVEPNAYRQVAVTPLVAGRITRVLVELGQTVRRGQAIAEIFSPELADAESRYVSARAELDAHERELDRTEKLVEIGAATRQELERLHAEHTARLAGVETARSRLELLGLSAAVIGKLAPGSEIAAVTTVPAPIAGVVTERIANPGLNVDTAAKLFTVIDLSTVWVVADVYEKDFARVRVGTPATVTTAAYPDLALQGRVSYIDPQVNAETRTARVRIEVPNPRGELRLGMYADVALERMDKPSVLLIPRSAVQNVGDRTVVYLAGPKQTGVYTERVVRLGETSGDDVTVVDGLHAGETIVKEGSFFVRAERERSGARPAPDPSSNVSGHEGHRH